ncbi:TATA element modulatory factor at C-terminar half [Coccomyxa sp. Obi]|nr:TATA element modulatory factor at C-terminar half [Coccomyxa sp. Obi]
MFTNFNFSLADLNINERLQQIKNDLEANIESSLGIDHAALAALTGDGDKGKEAATENGAVSTVNAQQGPVASPAAASSGETSNGWGVTNVSSGGEPTQQQAEAAPQQLEGSSHASPKAMRSPRSNSSQQPSSTGGLAAQRQGSIRSKSEQGRKGVRRLGAELLSRGSPRVSSSAEAGPVGVVDRAGRNGALGAPSTGGPELLNETPKSNRSSLQSPRFPRTGGQWEDKAHSTPPSARGDEAQQHSTDIEAAVSAESASDKEEAATGWEGDDELGSEDLQGRGPSQQHTDTEGEKPVPLEQMPLQPEQPSAGQPPGPAAEQQADTDQPPDAAMIIASPPAPATMSQSHSDTQEAEHTQDSPSAGAEQHEPEAQPRADGDLEATPRAGSLDRQPDTPPRSPPRSPLPAASAEPPPPESGDHEDAPEPAGAAHQRRPSDDVESTASTSHARDAPAPQEADVDSLPATGVLAVDVGTLDLDAARSLAAQLQQALQAREVQLERKFQEVAGMQDLTQQLMARNEELALKSAAISEEDLEAMRAEFESRLGAAERKVYALTKERDALRRGTDKLNSINDLVKEKDAIIQQVMEEGERLSKKQLAQENTIKKLRAQLEELRSEKGATAGTLAAEQAKVEAAVAAKAKAEEAIAALRQAHKAELEAEKSHYEGLLQRARAAQVEAEEAARAAAKEGLGRRLRDAEARAESLAETVDELRAGLDRQRAAADMREDALKRELADITRRSQAAESRHEELATALPEATRPLLRQIEAMQAANAANAQAWAAAERTLHDRLSAAEAHAAASAERERSANEKATNASARQAALVAALEAAREEASEARAEADAAKDALMDAQAQLRRLEEQLKQAVKRAEEEAAAREDVQRAALERGAADADAAMAALAAAEARAAAAEDRLRAVSQLQPSSSTGAPGSDSQAAGPPAMAGPGYKWVLVKEGEEMAPAGPAKPAAEAEELSSTSSLDRFYGGSVRGPGGAPADAERIKNLLRHKEQQVAALQQQLMGLEQTRDSLAEELVMAAQAVEMGKGLQRELAALQDNYEQVSVRLRSATELLGEKDERLAELEADVADMRQLYQQQVLVFVEQLAIASQQNSPSPSEQNTPGPSPRPSM